MECKNIHCKGTAFCAVVEPCGVRTVFLNGKDYRETRRRFTCKRCGKSYTMEELR